VSVCLCLSVCRNGWTDPTLCSKEIQVSAKINVGLLPSETSSQTQDIKIFCFSVPFVETGYQLSSRSLKVDARSVINWTVIGQADKASEFRRLTASLSQMIVKVCLQHDAVARRGSISDSSADTCKTGNCANRQRKLYW